AGRPRQGLPVRLRRLGRRPQRLRPCSVETTRRPDATEPAMTNSEAPGPARSPRRFAPADWIGLGILAAVLLVGLSWSKWLPYWDRAWTLSRTSIWDGGPLFDAAGDAVSLAGAWDFTLVYFTAVWKALL